jgi:hypothetical protein
MRTFIVTYPPSPARALIAFKVMISGARPHPKHPIRNVMVAVKKHTLLPRMSENRPYKGWNAVLVIKYEVVSQDTLFAALNPDPITAYVEAVIVPSKPYRKTLANIAREQSVQVSRTEDDLGAHQSQSTGILAAGSIYGSSDCCHPLRLEVLFPQCEVGTQCLRWK